MASIRPTFCLRLRLMALCLAAGALSLLTGCYSEFMGPAPGDLTLVAQQPGGSYRTGSIESTEYQVHFFWGIWSPKKTNSWETLSKGVKGRAADGAYDVRIETYMPWWHVFFFAWTGGIVDISGHTIKAETYKFSKSNADAGPGPGGAALPLFTTPPPPAPAREPLLLSREPF